MPWTQGEFKVPHNFVTEYNAGQKKIRADLVDENFTDIANAVNKVEKDYKEADNAVYEQMEKTIDIANGAFLHGGIVMFSGAFGGDQGRNPIPRGSTEPDTRWVMCDGGSDGKGGFVPDLRGRFIFGVDKDHEINTKGGSSKASVSGTVGETTLTAEQMPSHNHATAVRSGIYWNEDSGHGATFWFCNDGRTGNTGGSKPHTHSLTDAEIEVDAMPPYYALAYIMKVA